MGFPTDYKFKVTAGERFRETACRDRFFRLVTNRLREKLARPLPPEGASLDFKTSVMANIAWFSAGRIELHTEEEPASVECTLSSRRWWLFPLTACALVIVSAFWPEMISPIYAAVTLSLSLIAWAAAFQEGINKVKRILQDQIARVNSDASLRESLAKASS